MWNTFHFRLHPSYVTSHLGLRKNTDKFCCKRAVERSMENSVDPKLLKRFQIWPGQHKIYDLCDLLGYCDFGQSQFVEFWVNLPGFVRFRSPLYLLHKYNTKHSAQTLVCLILPFQKDYWFFSKRDFTLLQGKCVSSTHSKPWFLSCVGEMGNQVQIWKCQRLTDLRLEI